jgi:hypothetical protein
MAVLSDGMTGLSILSMLPLLQFLYLFLLDFRHLINKNLLKNLIALWSANFKGLSEGLCDNDGHQFFTLTQTGSVGIPLLQPVNGTFNGY